MCIRDSIHIGFNEKLKTLHGLDGLTKGWNLIIQQNVALEDLSALSNLEELQNRISIVDNPALNNLKGLENIISPKEVNIKNNGILPTIDSFEDLQKQFG